MFAEPATLDAIDRLMPALLDPDATALGLSRPDIAGLLNVRIGDRLVDRVGSELQRRGEIERRLDRQGERWWPTHVANGAAA